MWRVTRLGDKPRKTWKEAVVRWLQEGVEKKSLGRDNIYLKWLDPFLKDLSLDEISRDLVNGTGVIKLVTGVKPATVNRHMEVVRAILNKAEKEWGWINRAPAIRMLKEPKRRIRWLAHTEASKLLSLLPGHLKAVATFTLATGLREANVTGLQWDQVDLKRRVAWIHADQSKTGRAIGIPLNKEAVVLLRDQEENIRGTCLPSTADQ